MNLPKTSLKNNHTKDENYTENEKQKQKSTKCGVKGISRGVRCHPLREVVLHLNY